MDVAAGTANYSPTLACATGNCIVAAATGLTVTVSAVAGATFTDAVGTTASWVTGTNVVRGTCTVTDATTVTCRPTGNFLMQASNPATFLHSATPFAVSVPDAIGAFDPVLQQTWTDTVIGSANNAANDTVTVVRNGGADWQATAAIVQLSVADIALPPVSYRCATAPCGLTTESTFRIEATGPATFTNPIGSTLSSGTAAFPILCTVQTATVILCAPTRAAVLP